MWNGRGMMVEEGLEWKGESRRLNGWQREQGRCMVMVVAVRKLIKKEGREGCAG